MDEWSNICSSFLFVDNTSAYRFNKRKEQDSYLRFLLQKLGGKAHGFNRGSMSIGGKLYAKRKRFAAELCKSDCFC